MKRIKYKSLPVLLILWAVLCSSSLFAAAKSIQLQWENFPEAVKYNIKIMDNNETLIFNKMSSSTTIHSNLSKGTYKVKIGMVLSRNAGRVERETKWLKFKINSDQYQNPPGNPAYRADSGENGKALALLSWTSPTGPSEETILYDIFRKDDDTYVPADKTGFIRIGQKEGPMNQAKKYIVYKYRDKDFRVIGETGKNTFTVKGLNPDDDHLFAVRSVNYYGTKSRKIDIEEGNSSSGSGSAVNMAVKPTFILPVGGFNEYLRPGWGGLLSITLNNFFLNNLEFGTEVGFWHFPGEKEEYNVSQMAPLLLSANYNISIPGGLVLAPCISGGMGFISIDKKTGEDRSFVRPLLFGGVMLEKTIGDTFFVKAGAEAGALFDTEKTKMLTLFSIRFGARF